MDGEGVGWILDWLSSTIRDTQPRRFPYGSCFREYVKRGSF